jgi:hypothetical protein
MKKSSIFPRKTLEEEKGITKKPSIRSKRSSLIISLKLHNEIQIRMVEDEEDVTAEFGSTMP